MSVQLKINGIAIQVQETLTVLEAANASGIVIPTLCYHKDLSPVGTCRMCVVEVENVRGLVVACNLLVKEGMNVFTETSLLVETRRTVLSLLLQNYIESDYISHDRHPTEFEHWVRFYDIHPREESFHTHRYPVDGDSNPFIYVDLNKCILCTRCVRACEQIQGRFVLGVGGRGNLTHIVSGADSSMLEARCESCGACVALCPTGALDNKLSRDDGMEDRKVTTTCTYCGIGCQFDLNVRNERIIRVTSNPSAPVNGLHLCVKGRYGYDFIHHSDRLKNPMVRRYLIEGRNKSRQGTEWDWVETNWDTAIDLTAMKLEETRDHFGGESIGVLTSAKCLNEENYLMNKLARQVLGTNNIDHCARL
jgi:predicted molibdopterin-dependent oxidoreductase YjgC